MAGDRSSLYARPHSRQSPQIGSKQRGIGDPSSAARLLASRGKHRMHTRVLTFAPSAAVLLSLSTLSLSAEAAKVAVLTNNGEQAVVTDFTAKTVGHTYTGINVANQTPTLAMLNQFDAVLLFENGHFNNAQAVGNAVAEYYGQGNKCVVIGTFYWQERSDNTTYNRPGWGALEGVDVFLAKAGGSEYGPDAMDPASIVAHPVTQGVATLSAHSYRGGVEAKPNTTVLAKWSGANKLGTDDPVIGVRVDPNNSKFVGISIFPDYESHGNYGVEFQGDFHKLWENAFTWCASTCGNGVIAGGEECDDGNLVDGDGCTKACVKEVCGDGVDNNSDAEECDDGNELDTDTCVSGCKLAACGDAFVQDGVEACDDGNQVDDDACSNTCALPSCGDKIKQANEECDDANPDNTDACLDTCVAASCGDGFLHEGVETCDDANDVETDECLSTCAVASCGDGFVQEGVEACDDGNADDSDACVAGCTPAVCGDGFVHAGIEACDDANDVDDDECTNSCTIPRPDDSTTDPGVTTETTGGTTGDTTGDETTGDATTGDATTGDGTGGTGTGGDTGTPTTSGDVTTGGPIDTTGGDGSTGGSAGDTGGAVDDGCGCTATTPADDARGGLLALLGLGFLARARRRRS
jgi:MYXO-CTERM domain-containing protein